MSGDFPLVSIVTPAYNAGRFLEEAIESILSQDYPNIEYTVVDSESNDETQEIISRYRGRVRALRVPRQGPAAAIHAGLRHANGSILAWLNADDTYQPGAIRTAVETLLAHPEADVVYGEACWIDERGAPLRPYPTRAFRAAALARDCFICQPASFLRAPAYAACALDASLTVSFDYDLWIRMALRGCRFEYVSRRLANSRMHRDNLTLSRRGEVFDVSMALLRKYYGYVPFLWVFGCLAYKRDGRDQFFDPIRYSPVTYAASLPFGLSLNRGHTARYFAEWAWTPFRGILRASSRGLARLLNGPSRGGAPGCSPTLCHDVASPAPPVAACDSAQGGKILGPDV
jgi:glycosyltransferase involved in cell wall biosynthesis